MLNNEFIDFGTLLINPIAESKYHLSIINSGGDQQPSLCLAEAHAYHRRTDVSLQDFCLGVYPEILH